jgi:hypothetical protein
MHADALSMIRPPVALQPRCRHVLRMRSSTHSADALVQVHRLHALLLSTVPMLWCPLMKAHMKEQGFATLLSELLHRSVAAWSLEGIADAHAVALQALCQATMDALQIMCDISVRSCVSCTPPRAPARRHAPLHAATCSCSLHIAARRIALPGAAHPEVTMRE